MAERASDNHVIKCKICGQEKNRIRSGKYGKKGGRTPRWIGDSGKLWNGTVCPECHQKQCAVRQFIKKATGV